MEGVLQAGSGVSAHLLQPVDLAGTWAVNGQSLIYTRGGQDPEDECFVKLGLEIPAYMRLVRILKKEVEPVKYPETQGTGRVSVGSTIELDYYTFGVKVYIRNGKDGTLRIITEDSEGREVVAKWEREP